jgi:hypothetical protein
MKSDRRVWVGEEIGPTADDVPGIPHALGQIEKHNTKVSRQIRVDISRRTRRRNLEIVETPVQRHQDSILIAGQADHFMIAKRTKMLPLKGNHIELKLIFKGLCHFGSKIGIEQQFDHLLPVSPLAPGSLLSGEVYRRLDILNRQIGLVIYNLRRCRTVFDEIDNQIDGPTCAANDWLPTRHGGLPGDSCFDFPVRHHPHVIGVIAQM